MKKFVLFVMLMMGVVSVSAQRWSLTPEMGMMAVKRGGNVYINEQKPTWNTRWKVGVGVEFAVRPDRFSLKSGLYYTQRGYSRVFTRRLTINRNLLLMKVIIKRIVIFCRFR